MRCDVIPRGPSQELFEQFGQLLGVWRRLRLRFEHQNQRHDHRRQEYFFIHGIPPTQDFYVPNLQKHLCQHKNIYL
jgi:hypothetical protein